MYLWNGETDSSLHRIISLRGLFANANIWYSKTENIELELGREELSPKKKLFSRNGINYLERWRVLLNFLVEVNCVGNDFFFNMSSLRTFNCIFYIFPRTL